MKIAIAFLLVSLSCLSAVPVDKKEVPVAPVPKVPQPIPKAPEPVPKVPQPVPKVPQQQPQPVPKVPQQQPQPVPKVPQQQPQPVPKVPQQQPQPVPKVPQQQPQPVPKVPQQQPQPVPKVPQPQPVPKIDCLTELLKKDAPVLLQNLGNLLCNYKVAQKEQNIALFIAFLNQVNTVLEQVGCSLGNLLGSKVVINPQDAEQLADQVALILFQFTEDIIARVVKILDELPIIGDLMNDGPLTEDIRDVACGVMEDVLARVARILNIVADVTGGITKIIEGL